MGLPAFPAAAAVAAAAAATAATVTVAFFLFFLSFPSKFTNMCLFLAGKTGVVEADVVGDALEMAVGGALRTVGGAEAGT